MINWLIVAWLAGFAPGSTFLYWALDPLFRQSDDRIDKIGFWVIVLGGGVLWFIAIPVVFAGVACSIVSGRTRK